MSCSMHLADDVRLFCGSVVLRHRGETGTEASARLRKLPSRARWIAATEINQFDLKGPTVQNWYLGC